MTRFAQIVLSAVAPVLGVSFSILVMRSAGGGFPPALAWDAWAGWVIFSALVYTSTAVLFSVAARLGNGAQPRSGTGSAPPA